MIGGQDHRRSAVTVALALLQGHLGVARAGRLLGLGKADRELDGLVQVGGWTFAVVVQREGTAGSVGRVGGVLTRAREREPSRLPLLVVERMTAAGRRACRELGIGWIDLAGNAEIVGEGLRISVADRATRRPRGRPPSVFTPRRSRIVRQLLMDSQQGWLQRELAVSTGVSEADTSRVVRQLEQVGTVSRDARGAVRVVDPAALLADWRDAYSFARHDVLRGHVQARSGEQLTRTVAERLMGWGIGHAVTGLAGAWLWTRFAAFRIATVFMERPLRAEEERELGFHRDELGGNLWLVRPDSAAVFVGAGVQDSVCVAHPLQVYLDLKEHPERADEAAERLRVERLS